MIGAIVRFCGALVLVVAIALSVVLGGLRLAASWREDAGAPPSGGESVDTGLGRVHVRSVGPAGGRAVLLIGGTGSWSGFWSDVSAALAAEGYRAIAVDMPPFGYSEQRGERDYGRVAQARRLAGLVDAMGLVRPIVLGHSFGAGAVVELAARGETRLGGIVLVCAALGLPEGDGPPVAAPGWLGALLGQRDVMGFAIAATLANPYAMRHLLLPAMLARKEAADDARLAVLDAPTRRPGAIEAHADILPFLLLPEPDAATSSARGIAAIATPTAIVWGALDTVTPVDQGRRLHGLLRGSSFDVIPGVGHIPHIEAPAAFVERLLARLAELSRRVAGGGVVPIATLDPIVEDRLHSARAGAPIHHQP